MQNPSETSGEYRLRFRYELWAHAEQDFRSPALLHKRFKSSIVNGAARDPANGSAEPHGVPASDAVTDPGSDR